MARLLVLLAAVSALLAAFLAGRSTAPHPEPVFRPLTFRQGFVLSARFLPDGASVVYGAAWEGSPVRLFTSAVEEPEARPLEVPPADVFAVSPAGDLLLGLGRTHRFGWLTGAALARLSIGSRTPLPLQRSVRAASWSRDGETLAFARPERRGHVLELSGGRVLYQTSGWIGEVRAFPGGTGVVFLDHPVWGDRRGRLLVAEESGVRPLLETEFEVLSGLALAPRGHEALFSAARLGSLTEIDAVGLRSGALRLVLRAPGALRIHDVSPAGRLLVSRDEERQTIGFRRGEGPEQDLCWTSRAEIASLSADGSRALVTVFDDRGRGYGTTWLRKTDGSPAVLLGPGAAADLSPDGRWAVALRHGDEGSLALLPVGPGQARTLVLPRAERYHWARFTPDGEALVVSANEPGKRIRLYRLDLATGHSRPLTPEGVGYLLPLTASGDAVTSEDLDERVKLFPISGEPPREVPGLLPDEDVLLWLPGDVAYLAARRYEVPLRVFRVEVATGARRLHAEVGPPDRNGLREVSLVRFSADGTAVGYNVSRLFSALYAVDGVR